jgi:hypothetical protein
LLWQEIYSQIILLQNVYCRTELNQQKELFSKAYVRAVAAVGGFSVNQLEVDDYLPSDSHGICGG